MMVVAMGLVIRRGSGCSGFACLAEVLIREHCVHLLWHKIRQLGISTNRHSDRFHALGEGERCKLEEATSGWKQLSEWKGRRKHENASEQKHWLRVKLSPPLCPSTHLNLSQKWPSITVTFESSIEVVISSTSMRSSLMMWGEGERATMNGHKTPHIGRR